MADSTKKKATATSTGALLPGEVSTAPDVKSAEAILKNNYAGQWAFWHQDDTVDANGNVVQGELSRLLDTAIQKGWLTAADPTNFETALRGTNWYKANGSQGLLAAKDKFSNPAAWNDAIARRTSDITQAATALGYKLDDTTTKNLVEASLYQAYDNLVFNSNAYQGTLQSKIAQAAKTANIPFTSGAGITNEQKLRTYAQDMGVTYGDQWFKDAANNINDPSTKTDYNTYAEQIRNNAMSRYSGFSDLIGKGVTVRSIAEPYVQSMAKILEIDPATIDYSKDSTISKGLGFGVAQGGVTQPMPLWQFEQGLRQDPRWAYTNNARDYVNGIVHQIGRDFGFVS